MTTLDTSKALCVETDPDLFFSDKGEDIERAKNICKVCPILEDCLEQSLKENIPFGVWGGATYDERKLFKRQPRKKLEHIYITMGGKLNDETTKEYK
jgi:WhiB family redox-sensing transcriptional regulator